MKRQFVLIRVADTHHGALKPGMILALRREDVQFHSLDDVSFQNPLHSGGWSLGMCVGECDLDLDIHGLTIEDKSARQAGTTEGDK